jgi:uncharacterized protein YndB with AHSA1/START domain
VHVTAQTTVAAPIGAVWGKLSNHAGMSSWAPGVSVTVEKPGAPDPNGVGTVRRVATPGPGKDVLEEVVTFEPPHVLGYRAVSGSPFPGYTGEVRLTPAGAGTHISYTISTTAGFPLLKVPLAGLCQVLLRLLARASTKT